MPELIQDLQKYSGGTDNLDAGSNMTASLRDLYRQLNASGHGVMPAGFLTVRLPFVFFRVDAIDLSTHVALFGTESIGKLTNLLLHFMHTMIVLAQGVPSILPARSGWRLDAAGCRGVLESAYFYFESKASSPYRRKAERDLAVHAGRIHNYVCI